MIKTPSEPQAVFAHWEKLSAITGLQPLVDSDWGSGLNTVHLDIFGGLMNGVPSICATGGLGRLYGAYGEFLRFTILGLIVPRLDSHNSFAVASNSSRYHVFWRSGGNGPRLGQGSTH